MSISKAQYEVSVLFAWSEFCWKEEDRIMSDLYHDNMLHQAFCIQALPDGTFALTNGWLEPFTSLTLEEARDLRARVVASPAFQQGNERHLAKYGKPYMGDRKEAIWFSCNWPGL
jgi:hypothetical protein